MAQQLWFLRHGEAEPHGARADFERRLTPHGEEQSRTAGRALVKLDLTFQLVFTSPRVRALDTAKLACEVLGLEPVADKRVDSGFDADDVRELAGAAGEDKRILFVGHNPDFAQIVFDLTGAGVDFKKGGVAGVRQQGGRGELIVLLRPRELAAMVADPPA